MELDTRCAKDRVEVTGSGASIFAFRFVFLHKWTSGWDLRFLKRGTSIFADEVKTLPVTRSVVIENSAAQNRMARNEAMVGAKNVGSVVFFIAAVSARPTG